MQVPTTDDFEKKRLELLGVFLFRWRNIVLPRQMNEPVVLLVKLFVTELTAVLVERLVHLVVQLQAALGAQAFPAPVAREAAHVGVTFGVVLLPHLNRKEPAAGLNGRVVKKIVILYSAPKRPKLLKAGLRIRSIFGRIRQIRILKTGSGSYWHLPKINSNI